MEERKTYSSFPSNYLTLAQLQERWLKQHNPPPPKEEEEQLIAPTNGNASSSQHQKMHYVVKNRNDDSETRRRATKVVVDSDDRRKSEAIDGIGDETADPDGKASESKTKIKNKNQKGKWKAKTEKRGASGEGSGTAAAQENDEAKKKSATIELKEMKSNGGSVTAGEIEARVRVLPVEPRVRVSSINSGNGRLGKMGNGSGTTAQGKKEAEKKTTIENELKKKKKNGDSVTVEEVEQSVRVLSINSGNGKQNGGIGKVNNGFRHSRFQRKQHYRGEASYGYDKQHSKMVWVKKDEIET